MKQSVLPFLPGYMFVNGQVVSTGAAIPPTQHINKKTGEVIFYVRPIFQSGTTVGLFIRLKGIVDYVNTLGQGEPNT